MAFTRAYFIVNGITVYRMAAAPVLLVMALMGEMQLFKWFLLISFSTDAVDGFLARKLKVASDTGAKLDSIADDLTVTVAVIAMFLTHSDFIFQHTVLFITPLVLFVVQMIIAFARYGKITSFHTYAAKLAALLQGLFLLSAFFFSEPHYGLFIAAAVITIYDLTEEIILALMLKEWKTNVHGIWWVFKWKKK